MDFKFGVQFPNGYIKNVFMKAENEVDICWKSKEYAENAGAKVVYISHE